MKLLQQQRVNLNDHFPWPIGFCPKTQKLKYF